jgi:cyclopropane fatty-acyl-phospholipid synthase-like methyltransferase
LKKKAAISKRYPGRFSRQELLVVYDEHPLQESAILDRVAGSKKKRLTELDLAIDEETQITDQNHIGGIEFVRELAALCSIKPDTKIIDLGAGLGGPARILATAYGCRVLGIEISSTRCRTAKRLTALVGLSDRVHFRCADITSIQIPHRAAHLLWAQNSLTHIQNRERVFRRWADALEIGGQIALEDLCLLRLTRKFQEANCLAELAECWKSYITGLESWKEQLSRAGFSIKVVVDLSPRLIPWLDQLIKSADKVKVKLPERELKGWNHGCDLAVSGVLGYFRILATKTAARAD